MYKSEIGQLTIRKGKAVAPRLRNNRFKVAEPTGFEPATSDVTGRRSNQLNYDSASNSVFKGRLQAFARGTTTNHLEVW
jgi:hypothetical protein